MPTQDEMKRQLKKLTGDLFKIQEEWKGESMPEDVGEEFAEKTDEAEKLRLAIEEKGRDEKLDRLDRFLKKVPAENVHLPETKDEKKESKAIAGYVTLGDFAVASESYEKFVEQGAPRGEFALVRVPETVEHGDKLYVPLTKAQRETIEEKAVPTLATGVIEPQRLAVTPQVTADRQLRIRDVLQVGRTTSGSLQYVREESFTRGADYVDEGALKPEATAEWTLQTSNVETLAVWMPATVQQLSDWGQLKGLIDNRLRYDLRLKEEEEIVYGAGAAGEFTGLTVVSGTQDIATADDRLTGTPTIIDQIMVGATEIRRAGYEPNAVLVDPIDYEEIVLTKGTDDHYLRQVFPTADGEMRVWALRIVITQAMEGTGGVRNLIVGDFRRGAGLYLREDIGVMVGMKDDDLIRNLRTVLAEERAAFAIFAPAAFAVLETNAAGS